MRIPDAKWNGEPCEAARGTVVMAKETDFPLFWGVHLLGTRVAVVRVVFEGITFFISDDGGQGTVKVRTGGGPFSGWGHQSVPVDDPGSFQAESETVSPKVEEAQGG